MADRARLIDDRALPAAISTRLREREPALAAADDAKPLTRRAGAGNGARLGTEPRAVGAGGSTGQAHRRLDPAQGVVEADGQLGHEVIAAPWPPAGRAAEQIAEQAAESAGWAAGPAALVEQVVEVERHTTGTARRAPTVGARGAPAVGEQRAHLVVLLAARVVGQHVVGLGDVLETSLRLRVVRVLVRVQFASQLAIGLLDVSLAGALRDPEGGVVVLLISITGYPSALSSGAGGSATTTCAGRSTRPA